MRAPDVRSGAVALPDIQAEPQGEVLQTAMTRGAVESSEIGSRYPSLILF